MRGPNLELKSRISAKISARSPQTIWTPSDFADLGPRDAVDKAQPLWRRATLGGSAWAFTTGNVSIRLSISDTETVRSALEKLGTDGQAAMKKLEGFRLDCIVQKMTCPILVMHGVGDEQISVALAERLYEASGSRQKTLKVFSREEGGFHHCQVDDVTIGLHYMFDWITDVLKPGA